MLRHALACLSLLAMVACRAPRVAGEEAAAARVLDGWHAAAARADGQAYFEAMAADAVFLGTDKSERWTREEFRAYAEPYFSKGRGWTYVPRERHITYSEDGRTAWFDERLDNEKYGELRGTGVLRRDGEVWRIVHYSMSFPIPNDLTAEVVQRIQEQAGRAP